MSSIQSITSDHKLIKQVLDGVAWYQECSCGAKWSQPRNRTEEFMAGLYQSHVAYAERMATRVD